MSWLILRIRRFKEEAARGRREDDQNIGHTA